METNIRSMKKLIIILLFTIGLNAQVKTSDFIQKTSITGTVEIDGHESKAFLILETTLEGVRIYDRDTNKEYQLRKCSKEKCYIIHLVIKNENILRLGNSYLISN